MRIIEQAAKDCGVELVAVRGYAPKSSYSSDERGQAWTYKRLKKNIQIVSWRTFQSAMLPLISCLTYRESGIFTWVLPSLLVKMSESFFPLPRTRKRIAR